MNQPQAKAIAGSDDYSLRLLLQEALAEPIGLLVEVSNVELARRQFYKFKAEDPLLAQLQIRSVFISGKLFLALCKGEAVSARPQSQAETQSEDKNGSLFGL